MEPLTTSPSPLSVPPQARPLSAGDVVARSFSAWFGNFVPFSVVTLAVNVPVFFLAVLAPASGGLGWRLLLNAVSTLADLVVVGALTYGVLQSLRGTRVPVGTLFATGFARLGSVLLVSIGVGIRVFIGLVLLVVPGVVWYCQLYVAVPAVVVEPELGSDAIGRSRALTDGSRWAIFAIVLLVFVVVLVVGGGAGVLLALAGSTLPGPLVAVLGTAIGVLATPLGACASAVAYHDLRVAKEGVDTATLVKVFE